MSEEANEKLEVECELAKLAEKTQNSANAVESIITAIHDKRPVNHILFDEAVGEIKRGLELIVMGGLKLGNSYFVSHEKKA